MGPRSDFDILRILSHQLARLGLGRGTSLRTPEAVFEEIRRSVRGYDVSVANLLAGSAEVSTPHLPTNGRAPYDVPADAIFSSRDTLFTSGTLGRYCNLIKSLPEAQAKP